MQFVKVQYDAFRQQFNLMDEEQIGDLENGGTYLTADSSIDEFLPADRSPKVVCAVCAAEDLAALRCERMRPGLCPRGRAFSASRCSRA